MTDPDLERLSQMWREEPDPEMMTGLRRSAAKVARRARLAQIADVGGAIAVSMFVLVLVYLNSDTNTVITGAGAIFILWYSHVRQRRLREVEMRSLTGSTEEMLVQSFERVEATVKRARLGLMLLPFGVLTGFLFAFALDRAGGDPLRAPGRSDLVVAAGIIGLVVLIAYLIRSIKHGRSELDRLNSMRAAYLHERQQIGPS